MISLTSAMAAPASGGIAPSERSRSSAPWTATRASRTVRRSPSASRSASSPDWSRWRAISAPTRASSAARSWATPDTRLVV